MNLLRRLLPALLVALVLAACADSAGPDATGPTPSARDARTDGRSEAMLREVAHFHDAPSDRELVARRWIGPEGGRLELRGFAVDVPAGALLEEHLFTIQLPPQGKAANRVMAHFGPHGAKFDRPVAIELPYAGTSMEGAAGTPTVIWWDQGARAWVDVGGALTSDGRRVRTETGHFSLFGVRLLRSGGVTISGG